MVFPDRDDLYQVTKRTLFNLLYFGFLKISMKNESIRTGAIYVQIFMKNILIKF